MSLGSIGVRDIVRHSPVAGNVLAAVLRQIARHQPIGRGEIAGALKLSPATVSKAVGTLIEVGLVRNDSPRANHRGRPVVPLLWSDAVACVGVCIVDRDGAPSQLVGVAAGLDGRPIGRPSRQWLDDAARRDGEQLLARLAELVDLLAQRPDVAGRRVLAVGVQIGGHVHDGVIEFPSDTGHEPPGLPVGLDVRRRLQEMVRWPVTVENDVTALTVYESFYGATKAASYVVVVVSFDGVGAGVVLNGKIWRGHSAMAGEAGHIRVRSDGAALACRSGHRGCVEAYATPAGIMRQLGEPAEAVASRTVGISRAVGDAESAVFAEAGEALGYALATIVNWLNPEKIVLYLPAVLRSYAWHVGGRQYVQGMHTAMRESCFSTGAETTVDEVFVSDEELEDRCARSAAGLLLETIVAEIEQDGARQSDMALADFGTVGAWSSSPG